MRAIDRKLVRNLRTMWAQILAIVLIIACGVASFVTVITAYRGLKASKDAYYRRYRLADVFAPMERAPRYVLRDLEHVDGVRRVEGRIVFDVTIDLPNLPQPVSGRVLSVPDRRTRMLNDLHLTAGGWFEGDGTREVIVADRFARFHHLQVGDRLRVLMNNKKESLRIVGTAISPEFVYLIRGAGTIAPDPEHFTILWFSRSFAEAVFDFQDAVNEVVATTSRGARVQDVLDAFDRKLDRYGGLGAFAREDLPSDRYVSNEIQGLEGSATVTPAIFLGVAAFVLHMLMGRLVRTQRSQIALLRAFGYSKATVAGHYLSLAVLVGLLGGVLGVAVGFWFAREVLEMYRRFFDFPVLVFGLDPIAAGGGLLTSLIFAVMGTLAAVRRAVRLDPAEGLHPEAPPAYGKTLLERWGGLWRRLGFATRMILRRLSRTKARATMTVLGVALAVSILVLTFFSYDSYYAMVENQYRLVERHDIQVTFHKERGDKALYEVRRIEGVRRAEAELAVPVRLAKGWRSERTGLQGLDPGHELIVLLDADLSRVALPAEGLLLSQKLADLVGAKVGDRVRVEVLNGRKTRFEATVAAVVEEYLGAFAYARRDLLSRWIGESDVLTGVRLSVDPARTEEVGRTLKDLPAVAAVSFRADQARILRDMLAESQDIMTGVLLVFSGIIVFGVLYNAARISLAERHRELGSMRVLGFRTREVVTVLVGENLLLVAMAIPLGVGLGALFSYALTKAYETELFRFPFVFSYATVYRAVVITLVFAVLSNLVVIRPLRRLDLVEVLKARE